MVQNLWCEVDLILGGLWRLLEQHQCITIQIMYAVSMVEVLKVYSVKGSITEEFSTIPKINRENIVSDIRMFKIASRQRLLHESLMSYIWRRSENAFYGALIVLCSCAFLVYALWCVTA